MSQWSDDEGEPTGPPPGWEAWNGWADAGVPPPPGDPRVPDLSALIALVEGLRRAVPPELREQFVALQRELLTTVRAFIDWYLERLDAPKPVSRAEDIPID